MHGRPWVALVAQSVRHGENRERVRVGLGEFAPLQRAGHRRVRQRPGTVGTGHGAVAVGLVVFNEDALAALFLPPVCGDPGGHPSFQLTRRADDRVPHVKKFAGRGDRREHVQSAISGCLHKRGQTGLGQQALQFDSDRNGVGEVRARLGIQIDVRAVDHKNLRIRAHPAHTVARFIGSGSLRPPLPASYGM